MICGKTIVIDEIEEGIKKKFNITENENFNILFNGNKNNKCCIVAFENKIPVSFHAEDWEDVFADLRRWIND